MTLYLSRPELVARVRSGKEVAQWLTHIEEADYTIIKWLTIGRTGNQCYVTCQESFDEGDKDFWDVVEFTAVDPDEEIEYLFDSVEDAVAFAIKQHGASADKFVASGMICEEYAKYFKAKNHSQ